MSDGIKGQFRSGLWRTALSGFWQTPHGKPLDPSIPNTQLENVKGAFQANAFQNDAFQVDPVFAASITITSGSITLAGTSVNLRRALRITVSSAAITAAGSSVFVRRSYTITVGTRAVATSGTSVVLRAARRITITSAAVTLTGTSVNLRRGLRIAITSAAVTLAGSSVSLRTARRITVNTAAITLAGTSVDLRAARRITVDTAAVTLAGSSVDLTYVPKAAPKVITIESGSITLTGSSVNLTASQATTQPAQPSGGRWIDWLARPPRQADLPDDDAPKPKKAKRKRYNADTIELAPDGPVEVQTGIVETIPAWDALVELQRIQNEAAEARRQRLRAIALADDEWLMMS